MTDEQVRPAPRGAGQAGATPLPADALYQPCDPGQFPFTTTDELEDLTGIIGQSRAVEAIRFGIGIQREGYNLFVMGPPGMGKHTVVRQFLEQKAAQAPTPTDWCLVNNFREPHKPVALTLPPGRGGRLRQDMEQFVEELATAISAAFQSEEYQARVQAIEDEFKEQQEAALEELQERAEQHQIKLFRTPGGFAFAPSRHGEVISPEEFEQLSKQDQERIEGIVTELQQQLQAIIQQVPLQRQTSRNRLKELHRETSALAVSPLIAGLREHYTDLPQVQQYLDAVEQDAIEHADDFRAKREDTTQVPFPGTMGRQQPGRRYAVNLLVDNAQTRGAPVVYEDHPTYLNLVGRVEHLAQFGALVTDFTLIKPGTLHRANGGYLIVDARKLLTQPYAWEGLKRALYAGRVRIESLEQMLSLVSTVSLEPEPIPLDLKVVILGERRLYYLLQGLDPDFSELFKVLADFEERMPRGGENDLLYARLVATLVRRDGLAPFDAGAVARVIEHASRLEGDSAKLTTHMRSVADLLREADFWAREAGRERVTANDVQHAVDNQTYRGNRVYERIREEILRGTLLIATDGGRVGQVNALSVLQLGDFAFGRPSRITATARLGEGELVDIERETDLGGAIHSKGVLILASFLASRYSREQPLSLSASLVFEQSYGMVEGDSASAAELCALLSVLADAPINQALAITGSVNQHGEIQAIGGVNEKIEGFFDVCRARGLTGVQGVVVPRANLQHLMLRPDVVQASRDGRFHIYAVDTIDEAAATLTGLPAGSGDERGRFPEGTLNFRVARRLHQLSERRRAYAQEQKPRGHD